MDSLKNKSKRSFNIIDALIILFAIAAIIFSVNVILSDMFVSDSAKVTYVIKIDGVDERNAESITEDSELYFASSRTKMGSVENVTYLPETVTVFNYESDRFVNTELAGKCSVYITLKAVCDVSNNAYLIGSHIISAGNTADILLPYSYDRAEIISVSESLS